MIIDAHVHVGKTEKSERFFDFNGLNRYLSIAEVDRAVVMPNLSRRASFAELNDEFMSQPYRYHERFYPFILIDPFDADTLVQAKTMERIFGMKYHPSFSQYEVNKGNMELFFETAAERKLVVLVHCGRHEISRIDYLIDAARRHPDVQFIAAHLGGNATELVEEAIGKLYENKTIKNISLDTSNGKLPWLVSTAVSCLGAERVIFGSDEPYASVEIERMCIELAHLSEREESLIYSENIRRLLNVR